MPSSNVRRCSVSPEPSPKRQRSGEPMTDGNNQTQSSASNAMAVPDNIPIGPHTRSQGLPPAYTELEALSADPIHDNLGKSGRLAAKWIADLISGSLDPESLACDDALTAHNFYTITSQSGVIDAERGHAVVCICETCKKTFTILFECSGGSCRPGIERMHHIVPLTAYTTNPDDKYYPNTYTATYRCSATICRLRLEIQVCEARIPKHVEAALVDRSAAIARLEELIAIEPARYGDLKSPERLQKLLPSYYLLQYLNDVVNLSPGDKRQVSVRNKFFSICFADKMDLFEFLEFPTSVEGDETFVQLPALDDAAPESLQITPFRSKRAWFEVLRIHLSFLLADMPSNLRPPIDVKAEHSTREILSNILDARYARTAFINVDDYKLSMFDVLGVEKEMHELLLWYACICQNQTDPANRHAVFEAISHVSQGRESVCTELRSFLENEQIYWATEASKQDAQASTPLTRAYRFFNLPQDGAPVQQVLEAFDSALRNAQNPDDKKNARLNASIIAKAQKSQIIMASACTFPNAQEALDFVCHDTGTGEMSSDPDFIHAHLVAMAVDSGGSFDRLLVASAAKTLADFHGNHEHLEIFAAEQQSLANEPWFTDQLKPSIDYSLPAGLANIRNTCYLNSILQYLHTVVPVRDVIMNWESYKLDPTEANIESRRLGGSGSTLDKGEAFLASKFVEEMRALFLELQTSESKFITPKQRLALAALNTPDRLVKQTIAAEKPATPPFIGPLLPKSTTEPDPDAPPPLPDRPSQKHPIGGQAASKGPTVTVSPVVDSADDISEVSSRTLVDERTEEADRTYVTEPGADSVPSVVPAKQRSPLEDDDKEMFDSDEAVPATRGRSVTREQDRRDEKDVQMGGLDAGSGQSLEDQIMEALSNETVTGTDQQDVEEVMGNILEHLHAAIKPTGTDASTGKQTDQITETFYWRSRKYIRSINLKTGKPKSDYRTVDDLSRWMTAFPAVEGQVDLYTALDSSFDQEYQEDGHETFTSITRTSPILHVYIQRSQNINGRLGRNNNIVEIPETLCLDRYMDGPSDSDIFNTRKRSWNLKRRLQAADGQAPPEPTATKENQANKPNIKEAGFEVINANVDQYEEALLSLDNTGEGEGEDEYVSILDPDTQQMLAEQNLLPSSKDEDLPMDQVTDREAQLAQLDPEASRRVKEKADLEQANIQHELSTLFDGQCEIAYRLHAVICHGGGLTSGHYWVWIYDFKKKVWRKYNDDTVLERSESDTSKVLGELNSSSNPYYVAYVRVDEIDKMVAIPERIQPKREASELQDSHHVGGYEDQGVIYGVNGGGDVDMEDAQAVHIENRDD